MRPGAPDLLLIIDVQQDFCASGALAVPDGDAVVPVVNALAARFATIALTQDWHPAGHLSFASSHPGRAAFDTLDLPYGPQTLWPDHCVQGSAGAAFHPGLDVPGAALIQRKGMRRDVDSYSAFVEADRQTPTGLAGWLCTRGVERLFLAGLATDYCVAWTALDARAAGFAVVVVDDACRAIDLGGSLVRAWEQMAAAGVTRIASAAIL